MGIPFFYANHNNQLILYSHFLNELIDNKTIKKVEMINARNKLKAYTGEPINCDIKDTVNGPVAQLVRAVHS